MPGNYDDIIEQQLAYSMEPEQVGPFGAPESDGMLKTWMLRLMAQKKRSNQPMGRSEIEQAIQDQLMRDQRLENPSSVEDIINAAQ